MRLIKSSYKILPQAPGLDGVYKQIEIAGRTCYKSEDKITETSAKEFVDRMIKLGHHAMLEHGTVYLHFPIRGTHFQKFTKYCRNPYTKVGNNENTADLGFFATTNYRHIVENGWLDDLQYICEPTEYHEKRTTVKFNTQIAITREFNRHRANSMAEQSTRYCDYSGKNEKFYGVTISLPTWVNDRIDSDINYIYPSFEQLQKEYFEIPDNGITKDSWTEIDWWLWSNYIAEEAYIHLRELGRKPQEARVVLPLNTNTELVHTAFNSDWEHFFELRDSNKAHPDAIALAKPLHEEFKSIFSNV